MKSLFVVIFTWIVIVSAEAFVWFASGVRWGTTAGGFVAAGMAFLALYLPLCALLLVDDD